MEQHEPQSPLGSDFTNLLAASCATSIGDGVRLSALPLLATSLTTSPLLIGAITAAQYLPWTTFAPVGGVIVDRSDRRRLILSTQLWRALVMAALAVAVVTDVVQIWHLMLVAYVITAGEILVDPSVVSTIPTLVAPRDLDRANGRLTTVETVTNDFAGAPIGAVLYSFVPWLPFAIDAASYFGSILPFSRLPPNRAPSPEETPGAHPAEVIGSTKDEMLVGVRWIGNHPFLRPVTVAIATYHLGTAAALSLMVLLVSEVLDAPEIVFGLVLAAAALGAVSSSLVAARLTARFGRRSVVTVAAVAAAASVVAAGASRSEWQLIIVWTVNGAASGVLLAIGRGFVQRHTPNDRLGRTAVASRMITRTSFVIGALLAGSVATALSVRWAFGVAGLCHLVGAALLWRAFRTETDGVTA